MVFIKEAKEEEQKKKFKIYFPLGGNEKKNY
jgi:hypothetical protein